MEISSTIRPQMVEGFEPDQPSTKLAVLTLIGLSVVFLASVFFRAPTGEYFTICGFKNFTGLPCPGCGLTHSFCALAKGSVADALTFNLLGPALFLILGVMWIRAACVLSKRTSVVQWFDSLASRLRFVRWLVIAFGVYGLVRIVYLLVYHPASFNESPLSRLIARLIH